MKTILDYFEETTEKFPDKVGFSDGSQELTFGQATDNARRIATVLACFGCKRPVAIFMDRTCGCLSAMLGALYANDFYTIIDVHSPADRIQSILETLENPLVLADEGSWTLADTLVEYDALLRYEDAISTEIDYAILADIRAGMIDMDTAYVLFTSGSTGCPKGVVISHRSLLSYIDWVTETFGFDATTVFGSQTPLYFSMSVTDFYSTVKCGCTYHMIPKRYFAFPLPLIDYLNEKKVNTIYWVPTAISVLSNWKAFDVKKPSYLKTVLFAGEVMPTKQLNYWVRNLDPGIVYANLFGPTETTDICTYYILDRALSDMDSIPIGVPCKNCQAIIIKEDGTEATHGEEGELYVRTSFMADGYYRNPEKTNQAFVQNPLNCAFPERVYRTGDIVRQNQKGELFYISRRDFQIKRSGYRIELGEIEAATNSVEKVKSCACVYVKEQDSLVLFYEGGPKNTSVVLNCVKEKVPSYMLPDRVIRMKNMPKNANGKIDRKQLAASFANC